MVGFLMWSLVLNYANLCPTNFGGTDVHLLPAGHGHKGSGDSDHVSQCPAFAKCLMAPTLRWESESKLQASQGIKIPPKVLRFPFMQSSNFNSNTSQSLLRKQGMLSQVLPPTPPSLLTTGYSAF